MKKEKVFCLICNFQTNLTIDTFSRWHLKSQHNITMKEYYDLYLKKENEGICLHCGKETKIYNYYKGYSKFCCRDHQKISEYTRNKISESFKNRDIKKEHEKRKKTNLEKYGVEYVSQVEDFKEKMKTTSLEKYGVISNLLLEDCKIKRWKTLNNKKEEINDKRRTFWKGLTEDEQNLINEHRRHTCIEKYGVEHNTQNKEIIQKVRKSHEDSGKWLSGYMKTEYEKYRHMVRIETNKHKSRVFRLQDITIDYYTDEKLVLNQQYLLENPNANVARNLLQPTIDHKISVFYGFINNIDPKKIGSYKNLCICARKTNSYKSRLIEKEFIKKIGKIK